MKIMFEYDRSTRCAGRVAGLQTFVGMCVVALLLVEVVHCAGRASRPIQRRVLLPNGSPAARARVLVRTFTSHEQRPRLRLKTETQLLADEQGKIEIKDDNQDSWHGVLIIDVPDCALAVAPIVSPGSCGRSLDDTRTLRLTPNYPLRGQVADSAGAPVRGAEVVLADPRLNWLETGVFTPELTARSDADGRFVMRGISFPQGSWGSDGLSLYALRREGETIAALGRAMLVMRRVDWMSVKGVGSAVAVPSEPLLEYDPPFIMMRPTIVVRGQVINAVLSRPVIGAKVRLETDSSYLSLAPVLTGDDGRFEFRHVPLLESYGSQRESYPLRVRAWHPQLPVVMLSLHEHQPFEKIPSLYDITLKMRPQIAVSGKIIDVETGQPPKWPPRLHACRFEIDEAGRNQGGESRPIQIAPDGSFSTRLTSGPQHIGLSGPGFYKLEEVIVGGRNLLKGYFMELSAQDHDSVVLRARREPGFWIHLDTDDVHTNSGGHTFTLETREKINGMTEHSLRREWNFLPAQQWGETIEMRITKYRKEVAPWTKITADPHKTPIVVSIPTKQKLPVVISPLAPLRFSTFDFD